MKVQVIDEYGMRSALFGIGLSYKKTSKYASVPCEPLIDALDFARKLAFTTGGENKFLRQITVWLDITAPLYWWKQFDTYKVGTTAQSESTMHTLMKEPFHLMAFETGKMYTEVVQDVLVPLIDKLNALRDDYLQETDETAKKVKWYCIIALLPESYLQRRIVSLNYAVLQNIIQHRKNHKLDEWKHFCEVILNSCQATSLLVKE